MEQEIKKKVWLDELTSEEVKDLWDEAQLMALDGLHHPDTGAPMTREEAKAVIDKLDAEVKAKEDHKASVKSARKRALKNARRCKSKKAKQSRRHNR